MARITREEMFLEIAFTVAQRSTCERAKVGAVVVKDGRIVSMGYGGAPSRALHCSDVGCDIGTDGGCIRTIHAEVNCIAFAAKHGVSLDGATMFVTLSPCYNCAKLIVNSGIKEVYFEELYRDTKGIELLKSCGVVVERWKDYEG